MSYDNILGLDSYSEADTSFIFATDESSQANPDLNLNSEPLFEDESSGEEEILEAQRERDLSQSHVVPDREPLRVIYNLNRHKPFKNRGRKSKEKYVFDPKLSALENLRKIPAFEDIEDMFKPKSGLFEREDQLEEYQNAVYKNMICKEYATLRSYFCVLRQFKNFIEESTDRPYESNTDTTISNFVEFINNHSKKDSDNEEVGNNENENENEYETESNNLDLDLDEMDKENRDPNLNLDNVEENFRQREEEGRLGEDRYDDVAFERDTPETVPSRHPGNLLAERLRHHQHEYAYCGGACAEAVAEVLQRHERAVQGCDAGDEESDGDDERVD
uniref:Uncharacterized protein n=1 Tax=Pichia membranifaciens TaxID=4926 RepID=A0A1Q2YK70_9ASCO|nr:hypothetical protein PMKS-003462 [Pichia membranifaciens]